jgi:hypothetical protein
MFWPGVDKWPPPLWVWIAAAVVTVLVPGAFALCDFLGISLIAPGVVYGILLVVCLYKGANARLRNLGAEEFWESRPKD